MLIKRATIKDLDALLSIAKQTFIDSYADKNDPIHFENYINTNFNKNQIEAQLLNPDSYFYLVQIESENVAYLKLNIGSAQTDKRFNNALEIERIYVNKSFKNRGIGSLLIGQSIEDAKRLEIQTVWLGVWEINLPAIAFYKSHQFEIVGNHAFIIGDEIQNDLLMSKSID